MTKRGVGFLLVLTATIALGALVQDYRFSSLIAREQAADRAFDWQLRDLDHTADAMQAALQSTVAWGQTPGDGFDRTTKLAADVEAAIAAHREAAHDAETISSLDTAAAAIRAFKKTAAQVQASLDQGDRLHAADLVFLDGAGGIQKILDGFAAARTRNHELAEHNALQLARLRMAMNAVAVLFVLSVAIYFGRAVTILGRKAEPSMAQMLRDLPPAVKAGAPAAAAAPQVSPAHGQSPADVPVAVAAGHPVQAPRAPHLSAAAEVCVDLAKVVDAEDVPALLDRTAAVLDAKGIVIWAVDADGARLRPSLSHGYSDRVLAKLRPLQIDGDNVTSLAYRSLQPQAINGATPADSAALAVPLLTGTGCVGVMAVELRHNRPHADLLSIARIVAAQLSALIAPPEDSVPKTAHASS